jgi:hypothetical protein
LALSTTDAKAKTGNVPASTATDKVSPGGVFALGKRVARSRRT